MSNIYTDTISGEQLYVYSNKVGDNRYYKDKAQTIFHRRDGPAIEGADEPIQISYEILSRR